jgi:hypothetical protein
MSENIDLEKFCPLIDKSVLDNMVKETPITFLGLKELLELPVNEKYANNQERIKRENEERINNIKISEK